jgi:hypothetical protein
MAVIDGRALLLEDLKNLCAVHAVVCLVRSTKSTCLSLDRGYCSDPDVVMTSLMLMWVLATALLEVLWYAPVLRWCLWLASMLAVMAFSAVLLRCERTMIGLISPGST